MLPAWRHRCPNDRGTVTIRGQRGDLWTTRRHRVDAVVDTCRSDGDVPGYRRWSVEMHMAGGNDSVNPRAGTWLPRTLVPTMERLLAEPQPQNEVEPLLPEVARPAEEQE